MAKYLKHFVVIIALALATLAAPPILSNADYGSKISYVVGGEVYAQSKKEARLQALPSATTYAIVEMGQRRFENAIGEVDPDFITATLEIAFNGSLSGTQGVYVTYPVNATKTQVQTAVRLVVNQWLHEAEPANNLNNAHIILGGLSD